MYWSGITDDIKYSISACKACLTYATKQQREPYAADAQVKPWTLLSLDNLGISLSYSSAYHHSANQQKGQLELLKVL